MFKADMLKTIQLEQQGFGLEKVGWKDGVAVLWYLLKYRFFAG